MELIIATHTVKPSSPTPVGCKNRKLSSIDQITPPIYIPLIFFYENEKSQPHMEISRRLRQSLSEILTIFYPLAGTVTKNSFVDCDDRGAELVEARVHARLAQFTQDPKMEELTQLIPVDSSSDKDNAILFVKASYFDCGGIAVGACLSHKIGDASSFVTFMNAWAATCRGEGSRIIHPSFDLALHFPPRDDSPHAFTKQKMVSKRLVFDREKVGKVLQLAAACSDEVKDPTRVEAVSVFIWRSLIEADKAEPRTAETSSFLASHVVNLRPRAVPPIPDHAFGNCVALASAVVSSSEDDGSGVHVSRLRAAIRAVDDEYINKVVKDDNYFRADEGDDFFIKPKSYLFSSWWRFPVYDVDFGWGSPVWVCTTTMPYTNAIVLMSTPSRDGIEAWVNLPGHNLFQSLQAHYNNHLT